MKKRAICLLLTIVIMFMGIGSVVWGAEKDFPNPKKQIVFVTPWGPSGNLVIAMRAIARKASEVLGGEVVVIHKPGAGGTVAAEYVLNAPPDGYTIFIFNSGTNGVTTAIRPVKFKNSDFELLCQSMTNPMVLIVAGDSPWKSISDLIIDAKKNPGQLKYATTGIGTSSHLAMELFKQKTGADIIHLPFQGSPETDPAIMGHHVAMGILYYSDSKGLIQAGRLKALAVPAEKRRDEIPNVPTFVELGYPEIQFECWYGPAVRKDVPKPILEKLRHAFSVASQDEEVKKELVNAGFPPQYRNYKDFQEFVNREVEKYKEIAKKANIKLEAF
jgi:tripartite-type tricarboxylate transporter receptor subunit TctC